MDYFELRDNAEQLFGAGASVELDPSSVEEIVCIRRSGEWAKNAIVRYGGALVRQEGQDDRPVAINQHSEHIPHLEAKALLDG